MRGEQDEGSDQNEWEMAVPKARSSLYVRHCLSCFGEELTSISEDLETHRHILYVASMHNQF